MKDAILASIRRGLKRGPLPGDQQAMLRARLAAHARHIIPARGQLPAEARIKLFIANLEHEYASAVRLPDAGAIPEAVASFLAAQNLPPAVAIAPHPSLEAVDFAKTPLLSTRFGIGQASDIASLVWAFAGVAETGTVLLPSGPQSPTTLNLLPDNAIVVIDAARIVAAYEDAFDLLRAENAGADGRFMPRDLMLVTGPSRTADIEQTLELGAHGPRRLHVLVIDGAQTA
jgi:L-lactate dehydrogenase complex protein LldG